jgi:hypothetical protein
VAIIGILWKAADLLPYKPSDALALLSGILELAIAKT